MTKKPILVLVHPGSACGSADFNLGKSIAGAGRDGIVLDLAAAAGDVVVIDGHFSDEIPHYSNLSKAIDAALEGARERGDLAIRVLGDDSEDFNQVEAAKQVIAENGLLPDHHAVSLTGAWFDHDGDEGCVNSVLEVFRDRGFSATVLDGAMSLEDGQEDDDTEDEDEEDDLSPAPGA